MSTIAEMCMQAINANPNTVTVDNWQDRSLYVMTDDLPDSTLLLTFSDGSAAYIDTPSTNPRAYLREVNEEEAALISACNVGLFAKG